MARKHFVEFNFNPWKQNIDDCAIRSVTCATGMKYELVCRQLGVAWKRGHGLIRNSGIDLEWIKTCFNDWFDVVQDFNDNGWEEMPDDLRDDPDFEDVQRIDIELGIDSTSSGITLDDFCDMFAGQGTFLVGLVSNPKSKSPACRQEAGGHIVCAKCFRGKDPVFVDTWNSGDMLCDSWMRVNRRLPEGDPRHWIYNKDLHCFSGYGLEGAIRPVKRS